jgi:hypothetical protein
MHYYDGSLPAPKTPAHWLFYRPYGKDVFPDGWVVLFNRGYQAIFERRPGQAATVIAGRVDAKPNGIEQTSFFFNDGTDPRVANQRIDAELIALGLPPLPPMPRLSIDAALDRLRSRLYRKLQWQFPETLFVIDCRSGIEGSGRWTGSDRVRAQWADGPNETAVLATIEELIDGTSVTLDRCLLDRCKYH